MPFGFIASGGDLKAALTGAITGAAFAYVGNLAQAGNWDGFEKALAQGGVGGAGSETRRWPFLKTALSGHFLRRR